MFKRKTRSSNKENDTDVSLTDLHQKKQLREKSTRGKKLSDDSSIFNTQVDESTFATLQPVSLDHNENANDRDSSPPPLLIDTEKEISGSQSVMSDYFPRKEPIGQRLPRQTLNDTNRMENGLSNNSTRFTTEANHSKNINRLKKPLPHEEIRTPVVDRSTNGQSSSNIGAQPSASRIIVSVDRRRRNSGEDLIQNHRTSTPLRPSRPHPMNIDSWNGHTDEFSIDSIPEDTFNMLTRFPEFRRLVKAYKAEQKKCHQWEKDYASLHKNYKELNENSFPRPPPAAMNYLVELVDSIQQSNGRKDTRTDEQLARDLGENYLFLLSLRESSPQQTALNLFNHFFPSYEDKLRIGAIQNLDADKPGFLQTILTFSQRAAPGTNYKMNELRTCLGSSIRGARHYWNRVNRSLAQAGAIRNQNANHSTELQHEHCVDQGDDCTTGINHVTTNIMESGRRIDDDDCF